MKAKKALCLALTFALVLAGFCLPAQTVRATQPAKKTAIQLYTEAMQPGWNLGNTFDATKGDETVWGNPVVTKELIDTVAADGFKSIRIPVTWNHRLDHAPDYTIRADFLEKIQQVVDWSLDAGLYVMLNLHHDTEWIGKMETQHDETLAKYKAIWVQLSEYFGDYPDRLMFESINEPRFSEDWGEDKEIYFDMLAELNTAFHEIIRGSAKENNKTRPLVLPTVTCATSLQRVERLYETITGLQDPNLIATVHYYGMWSFSVNIAGETTFAPNAQKDVETTFDRLHDRFVQEGIPVIIGEYGLLGFDRSTDVIVHSEMLKFFAFTGSYAREKGMTLMLWDNGQHLDRRELVWYDKSLYETVIASVQGAVAQADAEYLFIPANEPVQDVTVGLSLQGDTLLAVTQDEVPLTEGVDYHVYDEHLLITKEFIEKALPKKTGQHVWLQCAFANSPAWSLYLVNTETPVLKEAAKLGGALQITTEFNGNLLVAMEATYRNGKSAGNQDWTTYKEFSADFYPDYEQGKIVLTDTFLRSLDNAEVTLTMHYLSGDASNYYVNKKDSTVIGGTSQEAVATIVVEPSKNAGKSVASMPKKEKTEPSIEEETAEEAAVESFAEKDVTEASEVQTKSIRGLGIGALAVVVLLAGLVAVWLFKKRK